MWIRRRRWIVDRAAWDGDVLRLDVTDRRERCTFLVPFDRPSVIEPRSTPRRVRPQRALARCAGLLARRSSARLPLTLLDADLDLLPYQLEPALAVLSGHRRLLIADEVGLGKTVQAGLVIAELVRRHVAARILVLVPTALRNQWADELLRRFGLTIHVTDRATLSEGSVWSAPGMAQWHGAGIWLASVDFLKQPHVLNAVPLKPWDLVVIDEVHDVCGDSVRHDACAHFARAARHVVMLTATPHSGDRERYERLCRLGQLAAIDDTLLTLRRTRADASMRQERRVRWSRLRLLPAHQQVLNALLSFEQAVLRRGSTAREDRLLLLSVLRKRALSTLDAFEGTLARRLAALEHPARDLGKEWMQERLPFPEDDDVGEDEQQALSLASGLARQHECTWLRRLQHLAATAADSKVAHLCRLLSRTRERAVVFTEFRQSLFVLERHLRACRDVSVLHGGQTAPDRAAALRRFTAGDASVLIATDVAGQGLNLQHAARWVICLEMPWNPVRLEQRIGRVDRIGQRRRPCLTLLLARHEAESAVLSRVSARALIAREALGTGAMREVLPPHECDVAAAVFERREIVLNGAREPGVSAPPTLRRRARAAVRILTRRRALLRSWQAPEADSGRTWTAHGRCLIRRSTGRAHPRLIVVSRPFLDGSGAEVERALFALIVDPAACNDSLSGDLFGAAIARHTKARSRLLSRLAKAWAERRCLIEHALDRTLTSGYDRGPIDQGLFDHRAMRAFDGRRIEESRRRRDTAARIAAWQSLSRVAAGPVRVELILESR